MNKKIVGAFIIVVFVITGVFIKDHLDNQVKYVGTIETTRMDIPSRLSTVISKFLVNEGDYVKKNELLAELDCRDLNLANEVISSDFDRSEKLLKSGSMPREAFDLKWQKKQDSDLKLSWCKIVSPIDGVILTKYLDENEWVMPGTKILSVADLSNVWAYIYLDQSMLANIKLEMSVKGNIGLNKNKQYFKGKIIKINDEAEFTPKNVQSLNERSRLVFGVKIKFDNPSKILKPGMAIEVEFPNIK